MYVYNIRLKLQMKTKQRYVVSYLHRKGTKLPARVAEVSRPWFSRAFMISDSGACGCAQASEEIVVLGGVSGPMYTVIKK
jgi:hypothetical protein